MESRASFCHAIRPTSTPAEAKLSSSRLANQWSNRGDTIALMFSTKSSKATELLASTNCRAKRLVQGERDGQDQERVSKAKKRPTDRGSRIKVRRLRTIHGTDRPGYFYLQRYIRHDLSSSFWDEAGVVKPANLPSATGPANGKSIKIGKTHRTGVASLRLHESKDLDVDICAHGDQDLPGVCRAEVGGEATIATKQ